MRDLNLDEDGTPCDCGQDHNTLDWIVRATLNGNAIRFQQTGVMGSIDEIAEIICELADEIGLVRAADLDALRGFVADYDAAQDLPVETVVRPPNPSTYDFTKINDSVYTEEEEEQ